MTKILLHRNFVTLSETNLNDIVFFLTDPTMNTLAAQTACGGGSSRSLNKIGRSECNHDNFSNLNNDCSIQNECHIGNKPTSCVEEDDVFGASIGTLRSRQEMRWELRYFFMNPYLKYKKRGRKPWKLGIQLLKIIFVTIQVSERGLWVTVVKFAFLF